MPPHLAAPHEGLPLRGRRVDVFRRNRRIATIDRRAFRDHVRQYRRRTVNTLQQLCLAVVFETQLLTESREAYTATDLSRLAVSGPPARLLREQTFDFCVRAKLTAEAAEYYDLLYHDEAEQHLRAHLLARLYRSYLQQPQHCRAFVQALHRRAAAAATDQQGPPHCYYALLITLLRLLAEPQTTEQPNDDHARSRGDETRVAHCRGHTPQTTDPKP